MSALTRNETQKQSLRGVKRPKLRPAGPYLGTRRCLTETLNLLSESEKLGVKEVDILLHYYLEEGVPTTLHSHSLVYCVTGPRTWVIYLRQTYRSASLKDLGHLRLISSLELPPRTGFHPDSHRH